MKSPVEACGQRPLLHPNQTGQSNAFIVETQYFASPVYRAIIKTIEKIDFHGVRRKVLRIYQV